MSFILHAPSYCITEVQWIVKYLLDECLGINYEIITGSKKGFSLVCDSKTLQLGDHFFQNHAQKWLQPSSLPELPLKTWDVADSGLDVPLVDEPIPVLFGQPEIEFSESHIHLGVDIFGTAFFMLSRYEEAILTERDSHDRFPGAASVACKASFLDRPIVDEYVEVLWAAMKHIWPGLVRESRQGNIHVTCDVDVPFDCSATSVPRLIRTMAGDLFKRHDVGLFFSQIRNYLASKQGEYRYDPYYTFDWYMDICEKAGRRASFYFICDHSAGDIDGCYDINEPRIVDLMKGMNKRGHELGMHGSYNSYQSVQQIARERQCMINVCQQAGILVSISGNRQHYLRWDALLTPDCLDKAGFEYDSTGSFADMVGFRYGTSRAFTMWSWKKNAPLRIKQKPLILMECSVISERYMGLGYSDAAIELMKKIKRRALMYGGDFTFLWHNHHLMTENDRRFFSDLVK